jgi:hypothetical protein
MFFFLLLLIFFFFIFFRFFYFIFLNLIFLHLTMGEYLYKLQLIVLFILISSIIAEEEASRLRFYVDEPAFTDLHWV